MKLSNKQVGQDVLGLMTFPITGALQTGGMDPSLLHELVNGMNGTLRSMINENHDQKMGAARKAESTAVRLQRR